MKQYRITSSTFNLEGNDPSVPDCYVNPEDLAELKKLAGIDPLALTAQVQPLEDNSPALPNLGKVQQELNIKPGTPEWFRLWFSRKPLTGETPY